VARLERGCQTPPPALDLGDPVSAWRRYTRSAALP